MKGPGSYLRADSLGRSFSSQRRMVQIAGFERGRMRRISSSSHKNASLSGRFSAPSSQWANGFANTGKTATRAVEGGSEAGTDYSEPTLEENAPYSSRGRANAPVLTVLGVPDLRFLLLHLVLGQHSRASVDYLLD